MIHENLLSIYKDYDSFLIDVYGVLYDGEKLYDSVLDSLKIVKGSGKKIIILSNTPVVSKLCRDRYLEFGLLEGVHYDQIVSSGEVFRQTVPLLFMQEAKYHQLFAKNPCVFEDSGFIETDSIPNADFIYVGGLIGSNMAYPVDDLKTKSGARIQLEDITKVGCENIDGLEEITEILEACLKYNRKLVVINPDIFAIESINGVKRPILCPGAIGEFYEHMGGEVIYFGKPYQQIYDFAKQFLTGCEKTAMVGDTIWTDILGGNIAGCDTILTLTGVTGRFFDAMPDTMQISEKLEELLIKIVPKMTHRSFANLVHSQRPTWIIERLA
ncbi:MAG: HAD hydrolase-like protein [Holosporales bacterium]|jgi:HAD superfamily hydrolase (TIGR01450 family)|nr:HAD hydrolase-like protein [Holosporales bacterium]